MGLAPCRLLRKPFSVLKTLKLRAAHSVSHRKQLVLNTPASAKLISVCTRLTAMRLPGITILRTYFSNRGADVMK